MEDNMDIVQALSGFRGRLNRKPYWIASLIVLVAVIVAFIAITAIGIQTMDMNLIRWPSLVVQVVVTYCGSALMVKRFQDRNRSGAWVLLLVGPSVLVMIGEALGFLGEPLTLSEIEGHIDLEASVLVLWGQSLLLEARLRPLDFALDAWVMLVALWFIVELGFFRGTRGVNAYGPDPLAVAPSAG
jgi:uncharacterized membrane protein YhaH (DUF805 family)